MTANANTIKLATDEDWISWYKTLKTTAMNEDLWDHLDPTKTGKPEMISTAPNPPDITYFRKKSSASTRSTAADTPSSSTDTITARTDDEDPTFPVGSDVALQARQVTELTEKGLRMYNAMWTNYEHLSKRHKDFQIRTKTVRNWILDTVAEPLSRTHCTAETTLPQWVQSIYDEFALAAKERKQKARRAYREILNEPLRARITTYKAVSDWLMRWRNAINEAKDVGLQEATEPDQWLPDLTEALRASPMESWMNAYSVTQINKVEDGTLAVGPVMADIRRAIGGQQGPPKKNKLGHGAFLGGGGSEEGENDHSPSDQRAKNKKRSRQSIGGDKEAKCPACDQLHPLSLCYYVFPEKKPGWFTHGPHIFEKVNRRLEKNEDNLVDRIRKIKLEKSA